VLLFFFTLCVKEYIVSGDSFLFFVGDNDDLSESIYLFHSSLKTFGLEVHFFRLMKPPFSFVFSGIDLSEVDEGEDEMGGEEE
jgi:membrane-anchored protein YejM (alkaline phosphatase superfamily)